MLDNGVLSDCRAVPEVRGVQTVVPHGTIPAALARGADTDPIAPHDCASDSWRCPATGARSLAWPFGSSAHVRTINYIVDRRRASRRWAAERAGAAAQQLLQWDLRQPDCNGRSALALYLQASVRTHRHAVLSHVHCMWPTNYANELDVFGVQTVCFGCSSVAPGGKTAVSRNIRLTEGQRQSMVSQSQKLAPCARWRLGLNATSACSVCFMHGAN